MSVHETSILTASFLFLQAMDTDPEPKKDDASATPAVAPPKKMRKVKKQVRKGDLPISSGTSAMDQSTKNTLFEREAAMVMEDKLVADTEEKKNELEAYIYDLRNKIDDQY